jgi:hypothetical protein
MLGFFLARVLLGRKSYDLGKASAFATIQAQLEQKLMASQSTSQVVHVGQPASLTHENDDGIPAIKSYDDGRDELLERAFGLDGITRAVLNERRDLVHRRNLVEAATDAVRKGESS